MQLKPTEDILPVTDFRNNAADILAQLAETGRPILLTQRGRASAVLLDVHEYQRMCDRLEALERQLHGTSGSLLNGAGGEAAASPEAARTLVAPSSSEPTDSSDATQTSGTPSSDASRLAQIVRTVDHDLVRELEKWIEEDR